MQIRWNDHKRDLISTAIAKVVHYVSEICIIIIKLMKPQSQNSVRDLFTVCKLNTAFHIL